nr:hypothetical protein [Bacteroidota bacterium]
TEYYFAIRTFDEEFNISEISNIATTTTPFQIGGTPYKFTLKADMILNEIVQGDATFLVDEQSISGDPREGQYGYPQNSWDPGNAEWKYPGTAIIDRGGNCFISEIYLFDMADSDENTCGPVSLYYGEPFSWQDLFTDSLQGSDTWNQHNVNIDTRYLRIEIHSENTRFAEIVVYGTRLEAPLPIPVSQPHQSPAVDQMIGINAFVDDAFGRLKVAGWVREYHDWRWCEGNNSTTYPGYPNNENTFNIMGWNFDYYYENFHNSGITACPAIQENVPWLTGYNYSKLSDKPVSEGENPTNPESYAAHADHLFQYAARYGAIQAHDTLLKLSPEQLRVSGFNYLNYYENWNEQDKWWEGRDAFFHPYEYAAMASADRDGHLGTMDNTLGIKNADPAAKLVMSGLALPDLNYVRAMKLWGDYYRNGDFPCDVINIHHYCNDGTTQSNGQVGISPEDDDLLGLASKFVDYRNRYLPGKEVWITEFGYDTHPQSVQRAPQIGTSSQEEVQGQWLVRSYLALASAGIDRAAMYMIRDGDNISANKFSTSGVLTSRNLGYQPKPSWYYISTMKNRLKGMQYKGDIESGNPTVWIYKFEHEQDNVSAYAVWCPTSNDTWVLDFELTLPSGENNARLVELTDGNMFGEEIPLAINNNAVVFNVSEKPVFLIAGSDDYIFPEYKNEVKLPVSPEMILNESGAGDAGAMADEQEIAGDPLMLENGEPVTVWNPGYNANWPCHAYIDLGEMYEISMIYLRDMNSHGDATFSVGQPGNWNPVFTDRLSRYKKWSGHVVDQSTRYVRITLLQATSNFSEIVIYVKE